MKIDYIYHNYADRAGGASKLSSGEDKQVFKLVGDEDESESWDNKLTLLLVTRGSSVGFGNIWLFT